MKKVFGTGVLCILIGLIFLYQEELKTLYNKYLNKENFSMKLTDHNEYYRDYDFDFLKRTTNTSPTSKKDLYNIYYSVLNSGKTSFSFYCPNKHQNCLSDVKDIANDQTLLSHINNFVHPFNSFKNIETEYNSYGKISIKITHTYDSNTINLINNKVSEIKNSLLLQPNLSDVEKIKIYHDYIVNNSKYDSDRSDNNIIKYKSDIAYGPLFEGYAICGGYTDLMAIFLNDMNIKNYKVSSENHVWNALYLNGNWLNLDLTWDDPITNDGTNIIEYSFFLINTKKLEQIEKNQHLFDKEIYKEIAN